MYITIFLSRSISIKRFLLNRLLYSQESFPGAGTYQIRQMEMQLEKEKQDLAGVVQGRLD